jgi:glycosyltransferase involved in cell wall biosynthesis
MMLPPRISVVIPSYNYAHLLPRALDSVLSQWSEGIELIVVDDGSTDNTAHWLQSKATQDLRVQALIQPNAGAAAARNAGIAAAKGEFVLPLDADDELCPGALTALLGALIEQPQAGVIIGGHVSVFATGETRTRLPKPCAHLDDKQRVHAYLLEKSISVSHGCTLFRRQLLLDRPYLSSLRSEEDIPVFAYALAQGPVLTLATPIAKIYKHADSLRHSAVSDPAQRIERLTEAVFERLPASCQDLKPRYAAKRWQSLMRKSLRAGDVSAGYAQLRRSLALSTAEVLRWRNLKKTLRAWLRTLLSKLFSS